MVESQDTKNPKAVSIEAFAQSPAGFLKELRSTGRGKYLTHRGRVSAVVVDPAVYQTMVEAANEAELRRSLDRSVDQMNRGEGRPAREALSDLRKKYEQLARSKPRSKPQSKRRASVK